MCIESRLYPVVVLFIATLYIFYILYLHCVFTCINALPWCTLHCCCYIATTLHCVVIYIVYCVVLLRICLLPVHCVVTLFYTTPHLLLRMGWSTTIIYLPFFNTCWFITYIDVIYLLTFSLHYAYLLTPLFYYSCSWLLHLLLYIPIIYYYPQHYCIHYLILYCYHLIIILLLPPLPVFYPLLTYQWTFFSYTLLTVFYSVLCGHCAFIPHSTFTRYYTYIYILLLFSVLDIIIDTFLFIIITLCSRPYDTLVHLFITTWGHLFIYSIVILLPFGTLHYSLVGVIAVLRSFADVPFHSVHLLFIQYIFYLHYGVVIEWYFWLVVTVRSRGGFYLFYVPFYGFTVPTPFWFWLHYRYIPLPFALLLLIYFNPLMRRCYLYIFILLYVTFIVLPM